MTTFRYNFVNKVELLALAGDVSEATIATALGTTEATVKTWRRRYPEFDDAVKMALLNCIARVADCLYDKALGGDVGAMKFFLERRSPAYMQRSAVDHTTKGETLAMILAQHGGDGSVDDARKRGLISDAETSRDWPEGDYYEDDEADDDY